MTRALQIWAIGSYRAGENTQINGLALRLAERLRSQFQHAQNVELTTLTPRYSRLAGPLALFRLVSLTDGSLNGEILKKKWPDVIVSAAVKNEPLARWIKAASGGHTKLIFLGRTWARPHHFDLVITTPQYRLQPQATVLENSTTVHALTPERLTEARARYAVQFAHLARPRRAVLVGGDSGPYALRTRAAHSLALALQQQVTRHGGSLMVTTSSRTHPLAAATLLRELPNASHYHYRKNDHTNPYLGLLAWADEIIVTSDSIAMISEALACGVPVRLFDLHDVSDTTPKTLAYRAMMKLLPQRLSRDIRLAHARLRAAGHLLAMNEDARSFKPLLRSAAERSVDRIVALVQRNELLRNETLAST